MLMLVTALLAASPMKLAVGSFDVAQVQEPTRGFFANRLSQALGERGVTVITQEEITALLGLERQRTLAGCDQANCTAELAGALGADGVLMAHIARLETVVQLDLKVISASSGERRATFATRVGRDVEILDALDEAARSLALQLLGASAPRRRRRSAAGCSSRWGWWASRPPGWAWASRSTRTRCTRNCSARSPCRERRATW
jgi:hypothetical protein